MGIRCHGPYINDGVAEGPEPGQNTIGFCSAVAAEQTRMPVCYLIGDDWWHDGPPDAGQWLFEHRFVEAQTEPFEHPSQCVASCELSHDSLGLGEGGRPKYPFAREPEKTGLPE